MAEGAAVPLSHALPDASSPRCPPDVCVAAVLGDALRRVAVLGGREGMPRSLGSIFGGSVARYLGGDFVGVETRVLSYASSHGSGMAVSVDGATLLLADGADSHAIREIDVASGTELRVVGGAGSAPLQFLWPHHVHVAADGFVFVADCDNHRVQVLTPTLDFHGFIGGGAGDVRTPVGVCASATAVVVAELNADRVSVFNRVDGTLRTRFGREGPSNGELRGPFAVCFMHADRHVAVADSGNNRVSVFSVDGAFVRNIGARVLKRPQDVACSACDELVVADTGNRRVRLFSDVGELLLTFGDADVRAVAVRGCSVITRDADRRQCVLWS